MAAEIKSRLNVAEDWSPPGFDMNLIDTTNGRDVSEALLFYNNAFMPPNCHFKEDGDRDFVLNQMGRLMLN